MPIDLRAGIKLEGRDWKLFDKFIKYEWGPDLNRAVEQAMRKDAHWLIKEIRDRIRNREYAVNKLSTAIKKGFKSAADATPLVDTGRLIREALTAEKVGIMHWEVGIIKDMKMSHDESKTMFDIIPILHEGATFQVTRKVGGKKKRVTIRIPGRPFLREVFEDTNVINKIQKSWTEAIRKVLKEHGKL